MIGIRQARIDDLSPIVEFQKLLYDEFLDDYHADLKNAIASGYAWVASEDDKVIGYQLCELFGTEQKNFPNSVFLSELFVSPEYRKQGIGSRLIQEALDEQWPKEYGYFSLTHDPNDTHLTSFYEKFGFKVCGKTNSGNVMMTRLR